MTTAIQRAYCQQARNPSDETILISLASELDLNSKTFTNTFHALQTQIQLLNEIEQAQRMGADSFPSLVLEQNGMLHNIPVHYNDSRAMQEQIKL